MQGPRHTKEAFSGGFWVLCLPGFANWKKEKNRSELLRFFLVEISGIEPLTS